MTAQCLILNSKNKGFSLIEIMVAISIIALIGIVAIPNLRNFQNAQEVSATAGQVVNTLRTAQSSAISRIQCPRGEPADTWMVNLAVNNYSLIAKCQTTGDELIYTKKYGVTDDAQQFFKAALTVCPDETTTIIFSKNQIYYKCFSSPNLQSGSVGLTLTPVSGSAGSASIKIEPGGIIKVE